MRVMDYSQKHTRCKPRTCANPTPAHDVNVVLDVRLRKRFVYEFWSIVVHWA